MILTIHERHLIPKDPYADIAHGMSARQRVLWLPASTPEAGAVALKLRAWDAEGADILPMHLCSALAERDHIPKVDGQVPFDTLLLILGLLHSLFFRERSLFE